MTTKELAKFTVALFKSPWMGEPVKFSLRASRRDLLLLNQFIVTGLQSTEVKAMVGDDQLQTLQEFAEELLTKSEIPADLAQAIKDGLVKTPEAKG